VTGRREREQEDGEDGERQDGSGQAKAALSDGHGAHGVPSRLVGAPHSRVGVPGGASLDRKGVEDFQRGRQALTIPREGDRPGSAAGAAFA
jgi:hypothetical protein